MVQQLMNADFTPVNKNYETTICAAAADLIV